MTATEGVQFRRIASLVEECLGFPAEQRAGEVVRRCQGEGLPLAAAVDLLLASTESTSPVRESHPPSASQPGANSSGELSGNRIGSFRIGRVLGKGGMGIVYLAEQQEPVRRQVAVKIALQPLGLQANWRIAAERQALARLNHSNIARILEAGQTSDQRPYFAMEYIDGGPVLAACDERKLGIAERLKVFLQVCRGVEHAHRNGILHRDLKPSNILASVEGSELVPKIIDFGIAKGLDEPLLDLTQVTGLAIVGTPSYIAPETIGIGEKFEAPQVADTRSDIYSLGVLLQEFLLGCRPHAQSPSDSVVSVLSKVANTDPPPLIERWYGLKPERQKRLALERSLETPIQLQRRLRGDLQWIVQKAIVRNRDERYSTVTALAADVQRHLDGEAVEAGPPTARYRLVKLLKRNRSAALSAALVLLALTFGFVARTIEARRANQRAAEAIVARDDTKKVVEFLLTLFREAAPDVAAGEEATVSDMLEEATERLGKDVFVDSPEVRADLLLQLAEVHWRRGDPQRGLILANEALELGKKELGENHRLVLGGLHVAGTIASEVGDYERSTELLLEALDRNVEVHSYDSTKVSDVLANLGAIHEEQDLDQLALDYYEQALGILERQPAPDVARITSVLSNLSVPYRKLGRLQDAEQALRRTIEIQDDLYEENHPQRAFALNNLGILLQEAKRFDDAREALKEARRVREVSLGVDHPYYGLTVNLQAQLAMRVGDWAEAEGLLNEAREVWLKSLGPDHLWSSYPEYNIGDLRLGQGDYAGALAAFQRCSEIRDIVDATPRAKAGPLLGLAIAWHAQDEYVKAKVALDTAAELLHGIPTTSSFQLLLEAVRAQNLNGKPHAEQELLLQSRLDEAVVPDDDGDWEARGLAHIMLASFEIQRNGTSARARELTMRGVADLAEVFPEHHVWHRMIVRRAEALLAGSASSASD